MTYIAKTQVERNLKPDPPNNPLRIFYRAYRTVELAQGKPELQEQAIASAKKIIEELES